MATVKAEKKNYGKVRNLRDVSTGEIIYPVTVGEAVVVEGKTLRTHIKKLNQTVDDLEDRSIWK